MHRSSLPILKSFRVGARTREERTSESGLPSLWELRSLTRGLQRLAVSQGQLLAWGIFPREGEEMFKK